jgi:hypothetical protein
MKSNRIKKIIRTKSLFESVAISSLQFELTQICKLRFREFIINYHYANTIEKSAWLYL